MSIETTSLELREKKKKSFFYLLFIRWKIKEEKGTGLFVVHVESSSSISFRQSIKFGASFWFREKTEVSFRIFAAVAFPPGRKHEPKEAQSEKPSLDASSSRFNFRKAHETLVARVHSRLLYFV